MSTKKIYLIRHGQTEFNLKGIVQGSGVDTSLNETGLFQADKFFQHYRDIPFKKIYTSSLKRSIQSVQKFIDLGVPYENHSGLNEISWGNKDGKIVTVNDNNEYQLIINEWKKGNVHRKIEGGESPAEVEKRIRKVIDIIIAKSDEDIVLICMHGRAIRILLASIVHEDLSFMDTFEHQNLCLYVLNYSLGKFSIEKFNDIEHLK